MSRQFAVWFAEILAGNKITTRALEGTLLQPGESATIQVVFRWKQNAENLGLKTIAIIVKDKEELAKASNLLADIQLKIIDENNSNYDEDQVLLLTVQTSKGLEFDGVIIFNENSYDENKKIDLRQLFVAKTRALHKLFINKN